MPPILRATYSTAVVMVVVGLAGSLVGLFKVTTADPGLLPVIAGGLLLSCAAAFIGMRVQRISMFLSLISAAWIITRLVIVACFPRYVLTGDEKYFHQFVSQLVPAIASNTIPGLSNSYDFPVWLTRAFPFYLPLAAVFGTSDIWAARILNVMLGAGQLICLFFIARRLIGQKAARLCCLLMLIFPYHCINVLSYDPQIAGTFFLLLTVWLFLLIVRRSSYSRPALAGIGGGLAVALFLAGIQRGGIDLLLVGAMLIVLAAQRMHSTNRAACVLSICLIWCPLRYGFGAWVGSQDAHLLRSHTLGFLTRGWNLASAGEYLPLYEQLDVASAQTEKQRTLEAVLVTEFARQPVRSLLFLVPIKAAKFFALGYASTAEQGLLAGGYRRASQIYQCWQAVYAPGILLLALMGLIRCWQSQRLRQRLLLPVLLILLSCLAIVLIWETSPRYSHPIQFAIVMLATVGVAALPTYSLRIVPPRVVLSLISNGAAVAMCWLIISAVIAGVAKSATSYQFLDPRAISAHIGRKPVDVEPLRSFTQGWEGAIRIPAGTTLPLAVRISFPAPHNRAWDHLSVSVWLPDASAQPDAAIQVSCQTGNRQVTVPAPASGRMARIEIPHQAVPAGTMVLLIAGTRTVAELRLAIGYALAN